MPSPGRVLGAGAVEQLWKMRSLSLLGDAAWQLLLMAMLIRPGDEVTTMAMRPGRSRARYFNALSTTLFTTCSSARRSETMIGALSGTLEGSIGLVELVLHRGGRRGKQLGEVIGSIELRAVPRATASRMALINVSMRRPVEARMKRIASGMSSSAAALARSGPLGIAADVVLEAPGARPRARW